MAKKPVTEEMLAKVRRENEELERKIAKGREQLERAKARSAAAEAQLRSLAAAEGMDPDEEVAKAFAACGCADCSAQLRDPGAEPADASDPHHPLCMGAQKAEVDAQVKATVEHVGKLERLTEEVAALLGPGHEALCMRTRLNDARHYLGTLLEDQESMGDPTQDG